MTPSLKCKGACIDNNHSHFILVDNGTVGKYGGEIGWRAKLQNCFAAQKIPRSKYVIDVLDCSNVQEAMERKKKQNRLTVASFYFAVKLCLSGSRLNDGMIFSTLSLVIDVTGLFRIH